MSFVSGNFQQLAGKGSLRYFCSLINYCMSEKLEFWMKGPVPDVPALLQPVVHALLQMQKEIHDDLDNFCDENLWICPKGMASVGFHLKHIAGVIDRMFTYAEEKTLTEDQWDYLRSESRSGLKLSDLLIHLDGVIQSAVNRLRQVEEKHLTETRFLGQKKIPVTLIGLLFHSAEHGMRHMGQMKVTAKVVS